jgi:ABC-type methionine transport system ATPase subunit
MVIIEVNHVTKEYQLGQLQSLKHSLQRAATKLRGQALPERPLFKVLVDVDYKIEQGGVLGIIGHNGAGLILDPTRQGNIFLNDSFSGMPRGIPCNKAGAYTSA